MIFFIGKKDYIKMFDLNYIRILNAVRKNANTLNDYSKLNDRLMTKEHYESLHYDLFQKYNIDAQTYTTIAVYNSLCDIYFKNYSDSICEKKIKYLRKNRHYK